MTVCHVLESTIRSTEQPHFLPLLETSVLESPKFRPGLKSLFMRHRSLLTLLFLCSTLQASWATDTNHTESDLLSNVRQLTFEGRRAGEGYYSQDGRWMVFQSEREEGNPFFQIYLLDFETGDTQRISPGMGKTTCAWIYPDGRRILFASTHDDPEARAKQQEELDARASGQERRYSWDYDEHFELYEANLSTGNTQRLSDALGYDAEGAVSPDGQWIVFASNRDAYSRELSAEEKGIFEHDKSYFMDIYVMRADGSEVRRLTDAPGYDGGPFFSSDGRQICWRRFSKDGATAEIYVMNADGSDQRQITRLGAMSWAPYFHPSGDYLVFATNRHGFANFELYVVDAEGRREPVRVTFTDGFDGLPTFSPDGTTLSWTSNRTASKQSQIFLADWNHVGARRLLGLDEVRLTRAEITAEDLRLHVDRLASEEMEGRMTGTEGERKATEYAARFMESLGLAPAGDQGTWFQEFEFTSGVSLGAGNRLTLETPDGSREYAVDRDWRPLAFSRTGEISSSGIVFAGYGIVAPAEGDHSEYDSYVHLDATDKWVLVFRYLPENVSPERRQHLARYSGLRYKAMAARERGAVGLLVVSGPNSQVDHQLTELSFDTSQGATSLAVVSISDALGEAILNTASRSLKQVQDELDSGNPSMGFRVNDRQLSANLDILHQKSRGRNVLGRMSSTYPSAPALVLGAHIDHLGRGKGASTLAREDEKGQVHFGADDNASGVSSLMEIAEYMSDLARSGRLPLKRDVVFAFWSGEELGLLGSSHFVQSLGKSLSSENDISKAVAAYMNLDMVGRLNDKLILQGIGSSSIWTSEVEKRNAPVGLPITTQNDSYLPTDSTSFYLKRVPVLSAFTGTHGEYHSPRDTPETLNYEGMAKVSRLMALLGRSVAVADEVPDYVEMKRPAGEGSRARLRAYLGTIPDYGQGDVPGLKISGVIGGGPAEQAGLEGGDIIVELAGRKIENIYDYTYAIEALKIGEEVTIVIQRGAERLTKKVTPGSRD